MMVEEGDLKDSSEFEISGYLQKKTTKGFYVNRYWQDQAGYEHADKSSEVYDICDIKNIEKTNNRQFVLYFMNEKFKLELKAASDEQCKEWTEVLIAKRSMYSVDELLVSLDTTRMSFKTKTFRSLLVLKEKDQNKFILDRLDDIFTAPSRGLQSGKTQPDPSALVKAARVAVEELLTGCEECMLEMSQRNPQVTVHCRTYIRRYSEIVKGRLTLELLFLPGTQDKKYEHMGECCICAAIELMTRVDQLTHYSFIPHDLVATLNNTLFTTGQLISSLLNLGIQRVDAFIESVKQLAPSLRSSKYLEIDKIMAESMQMIDINLPENSLLKIVLIKLVTSQMLCFTDHMTEIEFDQYEESALIFHVNTCDLLIQRYKVTYISLATRKLVHKVKGDMDISNENEYLKFPPAVSDALNSACYISSRSAVKHAVYNMVQSVGDLTAGLLHERVVGWIGGDLCSAFIVRLDQWVMNLSTILPEKYKTILFVEVGKLMVKLYVGNMIDSYHSNKNIKLSTKGVEQLQNDLMAMHTWITAHIATEYAMDERDLLLTLCEFITCTYEAALPNYAKAVQKFGIHYALHLYDIIRLVMKFRVDFSPKTRKSVLALCGEYLVQLQKASASDSDLLSGSNTRGGQYFDNSILDMLCPKVGMEHCTGKKWSVERLADPQPVRLTVAMLVTSTCNEARANKYRSPDGSSKTTPGSEERASDVSDSSHIIADAPEMPVTQIVRTNSPRNTSLLRALPPTASSSLTQLNKVTVVKKPKAPPSPKPVVTTTPEIINLEYNSEKDHPSPNPQLAPITPPHETTSSSNNNPWGREDEGDESLAAAATSRSVVMDTPSVYSLSSVSGDDSTRFSHQCSLDSMRIISEEERMIAMTYDDDDDVATSERVIDLDKFTSSHSGHSSYVPAGISCKSDHSDDTVSSQLSSSVDLGHRPLPKTPTPPMTRPVSSMATGNKPHVNSVRFNVDEINQQNAAKVGLKSRPLPPPPPPRPVEESPETLVELLPIDLVRVEVNPLLLVSPSSANTKASTRITSPNIASIARTTLSPNVGSVVTSPTDNNTVNVTGVTTATSPVLSKPTPPAKPLKRPSVVGGEASPSSPAVSPKLPGSPVVPVPVAVVSMTGGQKPVGTESKDADDVSHGRKPPLHDPVSTTAPPSVVQSTSITDSTPAIPPAEQPEKVLTQKEAFQKLLNKAKQDAAASVRKK